MSQTNIDELESADKNLLTRILNVPDLTPILGLNLELGIVPIRFYIQARKLVYYHESLTSMDVPPIRDRSANDYE